MMHRIVIVSHQKACTPTYGPPTNTSGTVVTILLHYKHQLPKGFKRQDLISISEIGHIRGHISGTYSTLYIESRNWIMFTSF